MHVYNLFHFKYKLFLQKITATLPGLLQLNQKNHKAGICNPEQTIQPVVPLKYLKAYLLYPNPDHHDTVK